MSVTIQITGEEKAQWRRWIWMVGFVLGAGLLYGQVLLGLSNQMVPPQSGTAPFYGYPQNEEKCVEEGGSWVADSQPMSAGSCYLPVALQSQIPPQSKELCGTIGGTWEELPSFSTGTCQGPLYAEKVWEQQGQEHTRMRDTVLTIGSALAMMIGLLLWPMRGMAAAFMAGGVVTLYMLVSSSFSILGLTGVTGRAEALSLGFLYVMVLVIGWAVFEKHGKKIENTLPLSKGE